MVRKINAAFAEKNLYMLDSPVSGVFDPTGDIDIFTSMLNVLLDIGGNGGIGASIGGGAGIARVETEIGPSTKNLCE